MSYLIFRDQRSFMQMYRQEPGEATVALYKNLVAEEYAELTVALMDFETNKSPEVVAEVAKEALDCVYVLAGLLHALQLDPQALWDAVHQSNIDKIKHPCEVCHGSGRVIGPVGEEPCDACGAQGYIYEVRRREDGKVQKPPGWKKPDLVPLINAMRAPAA